MTDSIVSKYIEALAKALSQKDRDFLISNIIEMLLGRLDLENPNDVQHMINIIKLHSGVNMPNRETLEYILSGQNRKSAADIKSLLESVNIHCKTDGWDGKKAQQVTETALANARAFVTCIERHLVTDNDMPVVVPTSTGGVCFYWRRGEGGLALEFREDEVEWDYSDDGEAHSVGCDTINEITSGEILGNLTRVVATITSPATLH